MPSHNDRILRIHERHECGVSVDDGDHCDVCLLLTALWATEGMLAGARMAYESLKREVPDV